MERNDVVSALVAKDLLRQRVAEAEAEGRGDEEPPEEAPVTEPLPIIDPTPKGIRARVRHTMAKAAAYLGVKTQQVSEYFTDEERGDGRKAIAAASVVGLVALAGAAYLDLKSGGSSGASHVGEMPVPTGVKPHHHEAAQHAQNVAHGGTTAHEANQHKDILSLGHKGDTIEGEVAKYLHTDLKDPSVTKVTEVILHNQGISWDDARQLPVGYSFNMPPHHMLEELLKNSNTS